MDWNQFLSQFIQRLMLEVLPVLALALTGVCVAQFKLLWAKAKAQRPDIVDEVEWIARTVVAAAEQSGIAGLINDKKAYAVDMAEKFLAAKGLTVDLDVIEAAIEAAVWQELNSDKAPAAKLKAVAE